ncbi:MAG: NAD-dependent epimerase/dehydratase family protein, partial [Planctomycetaceae bacterium]
MKVAVIGASGFLGTALSRLLVREGHEVFGFGRADQRPPHLPADLRWGPCDVTRAAPELPAGCEAVFYLSQSQHYRQFAHHADHVLAVNAAGAAKAAVAAVAADARFFCYASSGTVYAPSFECLSEDAPVRRDDGYALSKLAAEECLPFIVGDMTLTCVRIFGL